VPRQRAALKCCVCAVVALLAGCGSETAGGGETLSRAELLDPATCRSCHSEHYREWAGSMHAYASRDPVFLAMNRRGQAETDGALGSFCVNCHAPLAVREGATFDGLNLEQVPNALQGVTCYFCHNADAVFGEHNTAIELADDTTMRGRIGDPRPTAAHGSRFSELLSGAEPASARMCGACHDVVLPSPPAAQPLHIERTFAEWASSVFAPENAPTASAVATCNACHMPFGGTLEAVAAGGPPRPRHPHHFAAVDVSLDAAGYESQDAADQARSSQLEQIQSLLDSTLRIEICLQQLSAESSAVHVTLDNSNAGHDFPSGVAHDRRAWVELIAYAGEQSIYQSGVFEPGQVVSSEADPDLWLFRELTRTATGAPAHMFWEIAESEDLTIPVQVTSDPADSRYYAAHVVRRFPLDPRSVIAGVPDRVTVRVRLQPVGLEVLDDLIESGHLAAEIRERMPTFDLLPNRSLARPDRPEFAALAQVSMEYSEATRAAAVFSTREDFTVLPPKQCVAMPRRIK
jgi:hypothetical protein